MKLWEIFNTNVKLSWHQIGNFELASILYNNTPYTIQLHNISMNHIPELKNKKIAEVSFYRSDLEHGEAFSTTNAINVTLTALYGVVSNAVMDKFTEYDAYYFSAEQYHSNNNDEYNTKVGIYQFIAMRLSKKVGASVYTNTHSNGTEFIISKLKIENTTYKDIVREALKNIVPTVI